MSNIVFLGAPGSGKGTQSQLISQQIHVPRLSTGEMLRNFIASNSPQSKAIAKTMQSGGFVPDEVVVALVSDYICLPACSNGFILDGFPRNINQAIVLDKLLNELGRALDVVINLSISIHAIVDRICGRFSCQNCAANYHKLYRPTKLPGICDVCGSTSFVIRADDNEQSVRKRMQEYDQQTAPLIDYYNQQSVLLEINGEQSIENISQQIMQHLKLGA